MPWFKVDDRLTTHMKYLKLPAATKCAAMGLWIQAGTWSSLNLLDGFVPADILGHFGTDSDVANVLVAVNYWLPVDGGYQFVNWEEWQPTRADSEAKKAKDAERKRMSRAGSKPAASAVQECPNGQNGTTSESASVHPSRPVPSPNKNTGYSDDFEAWWSVYPKHVGKGAAAKSHAKAVGQIAAHELLEITRVYAKSMQGCDAKFIPNPTTWLNQNRWEDDDLNPMSVEQMVNEMWETGEVGKLTELTGMSPDIIRWPDVEPEGFNADEHRVKCRRAWIKENRDEIVTRLREAM